MGYQIHKDFTWDMGHRISQHGGKCFSPHGHSYRATVYLSNSSLDSKGMILDFYDLTQTVAPIVEELDHAFLLYEHDIVMSWFFSQMSNARGIFDNGGIGVQIDARFSVASKDTTPVSVAPIGGSLGIANDDLPRLFKIKKVPFESTAENIAKYIFDRVKETIPNVCKVDVWETPKCCATYEPVPDQPPV